MEGIFPLLVVVFLISSLMNKLSVSRQAQQKAPASEPVRKEQPPTFRIGKLGPAQPAQPAKQPITAVPDLAPDKISPPVDTSGKIDFVSMEDRQEKRQTHPVQQSEEDENEMRSSPVLGANDLVRAVIMSEVLGRPKALRH